MFPAGSILGPWSFPDHGHACPMAHIEIGASPVQLWISWIEVSQITDTIRRTPSTVGERRTQIVEGMRIGVIRGQSQSSVVQVLTLQANIQRIVARGSAAAASVDAVV